VRYALLVLIVSMLGCTGVSVEAGEEAVLTVKPWFFGSGGVDPTPVSSGLTWVAMTTDYKIVDMRPFQYTATLNDMMTSDGVPLDFSVALRTQVTDSVLLIKNFGTEWYKYNVEKKFHNAIRQAVRKHGMNETAISTEAIDKIDEEISKEIARYFTEINLPVRMLAVTVGHANPPDAVKNQRIATASAQQRIMTENETKKAEDARKMAEESRAAADNAYRNLMGLNQDMFLQLEAIKMKREVCLRGGCTFIDGVNATPVINVRNQAAPVAHVATPVPVTPAP
jgi:regulator of protease activity HflC (stomatin/prohibitin superfamily)